MERIVVIVTRQLGDVLLSTPLIRAARRRWPGARIDVLGFAGTLGLLRGNPDINELIEVPAGSGWRASLPLIRRLWRRYDLALIAQESDRAHLYGIVAARERCGLVAPQLSKSWWKRLLSRHVVEVAVDRGHVVLEKLALLDPWCAPSTAVTVVAPAAGPLPDDVLAALRANYVVIQIPSLVEYKQWPLRHFVELIQQLVDEGRQVALTGSSSARDRDRVDEVVGALVAAPGAVLDLAGRLDLSQVTCLLAGARLYIGPDTSVTHLAAACQVPVLALYGPVDPRIFGPWPQAHLPIQPWQPRGPRQQIGTITVLQGEQPCVPCNNAGCDRHIASRSECLLSMSPQRVLAEARRLLGADHAQADPIAATAP